MYEDILFLAKKSGSQSITNQIRSDMKGIDHHNHYHILYDIRSLLGSDRKNYLQIGSVCGAPICTLLKHASPTTIHCIRSNEKIPGCYEKDLEDNIEMYNDDNDVVVHHNDAVEYLLRNNLGFDIVYVRNSEENISATFDKYMGFVNEGGYIIFDNYNNNKYPHVKPGVDHLVSMMAQNRYPGFYDVIGDMPLLLENGQRSHQRSHCFVIKKKSIARQLKLAVIVGTYRRSSGNSKVYLERMMSMLNQQSYQNFHLFLMGDDYDNAEEFDQIASLFPVDRLHKENVQPARERTRCKIKKNLWSIGGANTFNVGLRRAIEQGYTHCVHLDDDDIWYIHHLLNIATTYLQYPAVSAVWTKGVGFKDVLPKTPTFEPNNFLSVGKDAYHSTLSFRLDRIDQEYTTLGDDEEENGRLFGPADADFINRIGNKARAGEISVISVPMISCFHDTEFTMA